MYLKFINPACQTVYNGNFESDTSHIVAVLDSVSMSGAVYYHRLIMAAFTTGMSSAFSETDSLNQFQANLSFIQSSVNSDVSLSSNEKQLLLVALAVGDRSAIYWQNQNQLGPAGTWLGFVESSNAPWPLGVETYCGDRYSWSRNWSRDLGFSWSSPSGSLSMGAIWSLIDIKIQVWVI